MIKYLLISLLALLSSCSSGPDVDLSQAQVYQVLGSSDFSFPGRERVQVVVCSDVSKSSFEAKAQTAMSAAIKYQHNSKAAVVWVSLVGKPDQNSGFEANAYYYSDGKGNAGSEKNLYWDVQASRGADTFDHGQYNTGN